VEALDEVADSQSNVTVTQKPTEEYEETVIGTVEMQEKPNEVRESVLDEKKEPDSTSPDSVTEKPCLGCHVSTSDQKDSALQKSTHTKRAPLATRAIAAPTPADTVSPAPPGFAVPTAQPGLSVTDQAVLLQMQIQQQQLHQQQLRQQQLMNQIVAARAVAEARVRQEVLSKALSHAKHDPKMMRLLSQIASAPLPDPEELLGIAAPHPSPASSTKSDEAAASSREELPTTSDLLSGSPRSSPINASEDLLLNDDSPLGFAPPYPDIHGLQDESAMVIDHTRRKTPQPSSESGSADSSPSRLCNQLWNQQTYTPVPRKRNLILTNARTTPTYLWDSNSMSTRVVSLAARNGFPEPDAASLTPFPPHPDEDQRASPSTAMETDQDAKGVGHPEGTATPPEFAPGSQPMDVFRPTTTPDQGSPDKMSCGTTPSTSTVSSPASREGGALPRSPRDDARRMGTAQPSPRAGEVNGPLGEDDLLYDGEEGETELPNTF
jgi:hypothetical protein